MSQSDRNNKVKSKGQFSNFSIVWDENYESGDDEECDYSKQANCASYMAREEEVEFSESDSEDHDSEKNWKFLYECEV